ncbi:MAG: CocE/NonD family hydrolase [Acidimicrobiia bacterium]
MPSRPVRTMLAAVIAVLLGTATAAIAQQPASTTVDPGQERPEQRSRPETPPGEERRPEHAGPPTEPGAGGPGDDPVEEEPTPGDYIALAEDGLLSAPQYETVQEELTLPMADGEEVYLEITRPDPAKHEDLGPVPVILEASPYHGTLADREGTRIFPDPVDAEGNPIGLTGYFAPRGYAVAMMDLRGTGLSTGCLDHLGPKDASDLKAVIEWLHGQDWSNGRIGMTGHSYVGSTPAVAAAQDPEGLVTIAPSAGLASMYDHQFHNGVPWLLQWIGPMVAYEGLALERDLPPEAPAIPVLGSGNDGENFEANGPNPQTGCGLANSAAISGPGQLTGQYEAWHAERDWREGAAEADLPVFMIHGVHDNAARIPASEWFFGGRFDREEDKVWIGQWDHGSTNGRCGDVEGQRVLHPTCRFEQFQYALHAWFDHHLLGTGVDTGPAVEAFLNAEDAVDITRVIDPETLDSKVYAADAWTGSDQTITLHPDATDGSLRFEEPSADGSTSFDTLAEGVLAQVERGSAVFTSEPLTEDRVLLGLSDMQLHASVTNEVTHLVATLWRVDDEGDREPVDFCAIQPQLRDGVDSIAPVVPGEVMALDLQCFTVAQWIPAGQHLELEISTGSQHHASFGDTGRVTVHTGPGKTAWTGPVVEGATLHDDVDLREGDGTAEPAPAGPARAPISESVIVPAPGGGTIVEGATAAVVPFTTAEGEDNASAEVTAVPATPADLDLYLERLDGDTWVPVSAGETGALDGESLTAGRLEPGDYRIVVHNWAGGPTEVAVSATFFDSTGAAGA